MGVLSILRIRWRKDNVLFLVIVKFGVNINLTIGKLWMNWREEFFSFGNLLGKLIYGMFSVLRKVYVYKYFFGSFEMAWGFRICRIY